MAPCLYHWEPLTPIKVSSLVPAENPWWSKILSGCSPGRAWTWKSPVSRWHTHEVLWSVIQAMSATQAGALTALKYSWNLWTPLWPESKTSSRAGSGGNQASLEQWAICDAQFFKLRDGCRLWIWDWLRPNRRFAKINKVNYCPHVHLVLGQNWYFLFPMCTSHSRFLHTG